MNVLETRDIGNSFISSHNVDAKTEFGCDCWPLHYACRTGNVDQVRYLVTNRRVPVNEQDDFDRTPLYLAALIGHTEICQLLLENGATCDPDSGGDAARIFYVALTPELRSMLKEWSLSAKSRDPYLELLRKSFNNAKFADCFVIIKGNVSTCDRENTITATTCHSNYQHLGKRDQTQSKPTTTFPITFVHRAMLAVRCPKLYKLVNTVTTTNRKSYLEGLDQYHLECCSHQIFLDSSYPEHVVAIVLEYLYTGSMDIRNHETALFTMDFCRSFNLTTPANELEQAIDKYQLLPRSSKLSSSSPNFRHTVNAVDELKQDMTKLAYIVSKTYHTNGTECFTSSNSVGDVTIQYRDTRWSLHRFVLCEQSDYFDRALHGGYFKESNDSTIDITNMVSNTLAIECIIQWMYCDTFISLTDNTNDGNSHSSLHDDNISSSEVLQVAIEVIEFGFAILCERLSMYVANSILIPAVDFHNAFSLLRVAQMYQLERLQERCVDVIGSNFTKLCPKQYDKCASEITDNDYHRHLDELRTILAIDASSIRQGGDVTVHDVPIAAEIRRAIRMQPAVDEGDSEIQRTTEVEFLRVLVNEAFQQK